MPHIFGNAACLSPAFSAATLAEVAAAAAAASATAAATASTGEESRDLSVPEARLQHARIYLDNGGDADGKTVCFFNCTDAE